MTTQNKKTKLEAARDRLHACEQAFNEAHNTLYASDGSDNSAIKNYDRCSRALHEATEAMYAAIAWGLGK